MSSPIHRLYDALGRRDGAAMTACYAADARFADPVFPDLRGPEVGAMWRMLCAQGADLRVEAREIEVTGDRGRARWEAWYTFAATGRPVHNVVEARFRLDGDRIARHRDAFPLWRWCRMALGPAGLLLGWGPLLTAPLRAGARRALRRFMEAEARGGRGPRGTAA